MRDGECKQRAAKRRRYGQTSGLRALTTKAAASAFSPLLVDAESEQEREDCQSTLEKKTQTGRQSYHTLPAWVRAGHPCWGILGWELPSENTLVLMLSARGGIVAELSFWMGCVHLAVPPQLAPDKTIQNCGTNICRPLFLHIIEISRLNFFLFFLCRHRV